MEFSDLARHWNVLGRESPFWAILSQGDRQTEFDSEPYFRSGEREIDWVLECARKRWNLPTVCGAALDFGCGAGRFTQALARHFERSVGVDIAPSMIELAERHNRYPDRCTFRVNENPDLSIFRDQEFDFVYSVLVLQHIEPVYSLAYIREFARVLSPDGIGVFQLVIGQKPLLALDPSAFRAAITCDPSLISAASGATLEIRAAVRNLSPLAWPGAGSRARVHGIRLANHWLDARGRMVIQDDGRAPLPRDLEPGAEADLVLKVTVPRVAGDYLLELDMVQENVAWFAHRGSATVRIPVEVRAAVPSEPCAQAASENQVVQASIEMHAVPHLDVERALRKASAGILLHEENNAAGPEWESRLYHVRRRRPWYRR